MRGFETIAGLELPELDGDHQPGLLAALRAMPVAQWLGVVPIGTSDGCSVLEMRPSVEATFDGRHLMGGIAGTFADIAAVSAVTAGSPIGTISSTTGFTAQMIAPAAGDHYVAIGRAVSVRKRSGIGTADVFAINDGKATLVATCMATARIIRP